MPPIITFIGDPLSPDVYVDVTDLPNPFQMNIPIGITNTHTATLYFKCEITSPPGDYSDADTNMGSIASGLSSVKTFSPIRAQPSLTAGEYDETLNFRLTAYTDAGYSSAYGYQDLSVTIHHFDHIDGSWTIIAHHTFDSGTLEGWASAFGVVDGYYSGHSSFDFLSSNFFLSAPYSLYGSSQTGGKHSYQDFNTNGKTKARFVIHHYQYPPFAVPVYGSIAIMINSVLVKPFGLVGASGLWSRYSFNMDIGAAIRVKLASLGATGTPEQACCNVDEIWIIAK